MGWMRTTQLHTTAIHLDLSIARSVLWQVHFKLKPKHAAVLFAEMDRVMADLELLKVSKDDKVAIRSWGNEQYEESKLTWNDRVRKSLITNAQVAKGVAKGVLRYAPIPGLGAAAELAELADMFLEMMEMLEGFPSLDFSAFEGFDDIDLCNEVEEGEEGMEEGEGEEGEDEEAEDDEEDKKRRKKKKKSAKNKKSKTKGGAKQEKSKKEQKGDAPGQATKGRSASLCLCFSVSLLLCGRWQSKTLTTMHLA